MPDASAAAPTPTTIEIIDHLQAIARAVTRGHGPRELHGGQFAVMRAIRKLGRNATVGAIAEQLGVSHAPASRAIDALIRKGFVAKRRDPDDRRVCRLTVTSAGAKACADDPIVDLHFALLTLDAPALADLSRSLSHIVTRL